LGRLIDTYCKKRSLYRWHHVFLFDGARIQSDQTPLGLEMENGGWIDCLEQHLGC
jgi:hypothetical protein